MAVEVTVVLRFENEADVPAQEDLEYEFECDVVYIDVVDV